uniref:hypothetical protein n=1 Tax=Rhizobium sp. F40D2 TaxID=3453141 RepID=UPI003F241D56
MIARLAYVYKSSPQTDAVFPAPQSFVAGDPTNVQISVKDSKAYADAAAGDTDSSRTASQAKRTSVKFLLCLSFQVGTNQRISCLATIPRKPTKLDHSLPLMRPGPKFEEAGFADLDVAAIVGDFVAPSEPATPPHCPRCSPGC